MKHRFKIAAPMLLLALALIGGWVTQAAALTCFCHPTPPFVRVASAAEIVAWVKVRKVERAPGGMMGALVSTEFEIVRVLEGTWSAPAITIHVFASACGGSRHVAFEPGTEWVIAASRYTPDPARPGGLPAGYHARSCGEHWVQVQRGVAIGRIESYSAVRSTTDRDKTVLELNAYTMQQLIERIAEARNGVIPESER